MQINNVSLFAKIFEQYVLSVIFIFIPFDHLHSLKKGKIPAALKKWLLVFFYLLFYFDGTVFALYMFERKQVNVI